MTRPAVVTFSVQDRISRRCPLLCERRDGCRRIGLYDVHRWPVPGWRPRCIARIRTAKRCRIAAYVCRSICGSGGGGSDGASRGARWADPEYVDPVRAARMPLWMRSPSGVAAWSQIHLACPLLDESVAAAASIRCAISAPVSTLHCPRGPQRDGQNPSGCSKFSTRSRPWALRFPGRLLELPQCA